MLLLFDHEDIFKRSFYPSHKVWLLVLIRIFSGFLFNTEFFDFGLCLLSCSGLQSSKETPTIIFLCGFPDTSDSWSRLAPHFESSHHVIKIAMPDYENDRLRRFWGYSPEDIVKGLALIVEPHWKKQSQVILVGHDWGSYICLLYLIAYPDTVHKFVTLDIGIRDTLDLVSVCYMTYLAFVFFMSRILPDQLALLLIALYPWKFIGPCPYEVIKIINKFLYFDVMVASHSIFFHSSLFLTNLFRTSNKD